MLTVYSQYFEDILDEIHDPDYGDQETVGEPGYINEDNFEDYAADDDTVEEIGQGPEHIEDWMSEVPRTTEDVPENVVEVIYDNKTPEKSSEALVYDGINKNEVISFDYINRKGFYAGYRTVEPHYLFTARTTNNLVLVSFDLDVGDVRTFILKNNNMKVSRDGGGRILPNGVRYEGWTFVRRPEIDAGVNLRT